MAKKPISKIEEKLIVAKKICDQYAQGMHTIADCADAQGINVRTFMYWEQEFSEISDMYKEAKQLHQKSMEHAALKSLRKLIEGFSVEEVTQEVEPIYDGSGQQIGTKRKSIRQTKKHFAPNVTAIIFALKAIDPAKFKDYLPPQVEEEQTFLIGGKEVKF